jgi:hypothetical protein
VQARGRSSGDFCGPTSAHLALPEAT